MTTNILTNLSFLPPFIKIWVTWAWRSKNSYNHHDSACLRVFFDGSLLRMCILRYGLTMHGKWMVSWQMSKTSHHDIRWHPMTSCYASLPSLRCFCLDSGGRWIDGSTWKTSSAEASGSALLAEGRGPGKTIPPFGREKWGKLQKVMMEIYWWKKNIYYWNIYIYMRIMRVYHVYCTDFF